jgi:hypothetical protein
VTIGFSFFREYVRACVSLRGRAKLRFSNNFHTKLVFSNVYYSGKNSKLAMFTTEENLAMFTQEEVNIPAMIE